MSAGRELQRKLRFRQGCYVNTRLEVNMYSFIARQPIFDAALNTVAYELLYRNGLTNTFPLVTEEYATNHLLAEQFLVTPLQRLVGQHTSYINFPHEMIVNGLAQTLPAEKVVIEIHQNAAPEPELLKMVREMYYKGFRFALDNFRLSDAWANFLPYVTIIKFDIQALTPQEVSAFIRDNNISQRKLLAEKVETREQFNLYKEMGFQRFQGYFYGEPEMIKTRKLPEQQMFILQLLNEVVSANPDMRKIEELISRDVAITYKLMRYVNNIKYKINHHANADVLPFRNILYFLGLSELRRFIAILAVTHSSEPAVTELFNYSLACGRFCEMAVAHTGADINENDAFIAGLFSRLDIILSVPMAVLIEQITVPAIVREALLNRGGTLGALLNLYEGYEQNHWQGVTQGMKQLNMSEAQVTQLFLDAVEWGDRII